ncbi:hypothetical protein EON63_05610 [archaeon]|nr:MAG: hypothetical protein EON63_05610 [archaeon]
MLFWRGATRGLSGTEVYIEFLQGQRLTSHGKSLQDILAYNDRQLEADHQFIQWIFPLPDPSPYNPNAPLIDIRLLLSNSIVKDKILLSYEKMRNFWGLGDEIDLEKLEKLNGHNGLRFSRALQSLVYHDQQALAEHLLEKALANLHVLKPKMHASGVTLWQNLYEKAVREVGDARSSP